MQTKEQWDRPTNWKVVAAVAAASALGLSGLAVATTGGSEQGPDPIDLQDRSDVSSTTIGSSSNSTVPTTVGQALDQVSGSLDSPFDDSGRNAASPGAHSPSADSPAGVTSTSTTTSTTVAKVPADQDSPSPDSPSPASPSVDSYSADSSAGSFSGSGDSGSADS